MESKSGKRRSRNLPFVFSVCIGCLFSSCTQERRNESEPFQNIPENPQPVTEFIATEKSFDCFLPPFQDQKPIEERWFKVGNFYIKNLTGRTRTALQIASGLKEGRYPVGTIIQLVPFEAMVKRGGSFCPSGNGWEFFALDLTGTQEVLIRSRGCEEVVNFFNQVSCLSCHGKAEEKYDFVCDGNHGCDPLGVPQELIRSIQEGDPRCPSP
jgi:hypothetical protein